MKSILIFAGLFFAVPIASAQEGAFVHSISFSGNNSFSENDLRNVMLTKEAPAPFYRFVYRIFRIGKPTELFDPFVFKADAQRIKQFYKNNGYFYTRLDTSEKYNVDDNEIYISIKVERGIPAFVDSVSYFGIADNSNDFFRMLKEKPLLTDGARYSVDVDLMVK